MKRLKASQARALIGQTVPIVRAYRDYMHSPRFYTILSVQGRNLEVDCMGCVDWLWLPDCLIGDPLPEQLTPTP